MEKKIQQAIRLIQSAAKRRGVLEVGYSGGKDSDVILELVKMADVPYRAIYKNTTIDPPGTIAHCKSKGVEIRHPKKSFLRLIEEAGLPNRWSRFCCKVLKEYKISDSVVIGVRREESYKRKKRYQEPIVCRGSGDDHVSQILPILDWTTEDLSEFIRLRGIELHPHYRCDGRYDLSRRLGCIGCPLKYYKERLFDLAKYPKMAAAFEHACANYKNTHPNNKTELSAKQWFVCDIFAEVSSFSEAVKNKEKLCDIFDRIISGEITPDMIKRRDFRKKFLNFIKTSRQRRKK